MKKRVSIFGRKESTGKPPWGEDGGTLRVVGEGHFWKRGHTIPRTWRRREFKLREDAVLFYFDAGRLRGSIDVTDISLGAGLEKNLQKSGVMALGFHTPIAAELHSVYDEKTFEIVFDGKEAADRFCAMLMKVTVSAANVEQFVRDFHWREANRLLGELELEDDGASDRGTTMTSLAAGEIPNGKLSWDDGISLAIIGEGEFWKKGQRVKNWKRRLYKLREDGLLFYFEAGRERPKGCRDLCAVSLRVGLGTNLEDSGAIDFSEEEAVPVELSFADSSSRFMELVFDSAVSARQFAQAVSKTAASHNVPEFLEAIEDPAKLPKFADGPGGSERRRARRGSAAPAVEGSVLLQGQWLKRGRMRNVLKKREFRIISRKEGSTSRGTFEYMYGDNGYFKKSIDVYHIFLRAVDAGELDGTAEIVHMEIMFVSTAIASLNLEGGSPPASSVDAVVPFALEGMENTEKFCEVLQDVALSSNIEAFLAELRARPATQTSSSHPKVTAARGTDTAAGPSAPAMAPTNTIGSAPSSTEFAVVYEGVFIKRTKVMNSWKSRGFKLKRSVDTPDGEGFAQLEYKGFGAFSTKVDITDVTLTLKDGDVKIPGGEGDYTQFSIYSNTEKERIDVAMFGRHDIDAFCAHLAEVCRVHNVDKFLSEFHSSPLGRARKAMYTYLQGTFLRQGLQTLSWKRKQYRICKVVDSTVDPPTEYGILRFGPEQTKPADWRGYINLTDVTLSIDSTVSHGSDAIIINANDASTAPIDENHRKLVLILDPYGCREGSAQRRERLRAAREAGGEDSDDERGSDGADSGSGSDTEELAGEEAAGPRRTHPSVNEICTFLMAIATRAPNSNAMELAENFGARRGRRGMANGKAAILFYISTGLLVFASLWVVFMPSVSSLTALAVLIALMGVFVGNSVSVNKNIMRKP